MTVLPPIVTTIEVGGPTELAFEIFTTRMGSWWPHLGHSVGEENVEAVGMEPRLGGRLFERWRDGTEHAWGTIHTFEPPHRLAFSWDPTERGVETDVEVTFTSMPAGTRVVLTHRNWELLGALAEELRSSYETGWPTVLRSFVEAASGARQ